MPTLVPRSEAEALASGGMTYHGSSSHGAQRRSLFPDAPVCITAGGLRCSHTHGRGMTEHLNGAAAIAGCSGLCRWVEPFSLGRGIVVPQDSIYHMSEGYRLCDPRMCGPRSSSSCHRRMTPKGPRSSWEEDSLSPANWFSHLVAFMKCPPALRGAREHWSSANPHSFPLKCSGRRGLPGTFGLQRECIWPWVPLLPREPLTCSLGPSIAWNFPQRGLYFPDLGWNVQPPCLTLL